MKGRMECSNDTDASLPTLEKHPRRFEVLPVVLLLLKVVVGVGGVIMVTNLALFGAESPSMPAKNNTGRAQLVATPGRSWLGAGNIRHHLRGETSRLADEGEDATAVHPGVGAAPGIGNQAEAAATPRRLQMLPMEGHRGGWFLAPIARSDEKEQNGESPEEGRKDEGSKDWLVTDADADDYGSGYHATYAHLDDDEGTVSGHGRGQRKISVGERREQREDEEGKPNRLKTLPFSNNGYHAGNGGRVVPDRGWGQAKEEGGGGTKSERAKLRQYDADLGTSRGESDAMETSFDHDGREHRGQGTLAKNPYNPLADEPEVPQSRRRFRHEYWEEGNYISTTTWSQSEDDEEVTGTWDTDDDLSMHVAHYSRAVTGNQDMSPTTSADPTRRRRQWERERASLWDTDDDALLFDDAYHHLDAAGDAINDNAVADMPAAQVHTESRASWATDEPDEGSRYDVSGVSSKTRENGKAADKLFGGWKYDDDFERHDYHSSRTSRDGSGAQGQGITDDWEVDGGTHVFEAGKMFAAVEDDDGGHATASEQGEEEGEDEEDDDDLAFGSMFDYYDWFAYGRDEIPAAAAAAAVGIGEETDEEEKAANEPYTEYYSYLAEMKQLRQQEKKQLRQQESLERVDADVQEERQQQPSKRHGVKTTNSVVASKQPEHPLEKQEKEGGRLGLLENALSEAFSRAEKGGSLGFLDPLVPPKLSGGRDEASSRGEAREQPQTKDDHDESEKERGLIGADALEFSLGGVAEVARKLRGAEDGGRPPSTGDV